MQQTLSAFKAAHGLTWAQVGYLVGGKNRKQQSNDEMGRRFHREGYTVKSEAPGKFEVVRPERVKESFNARAIESAKRAYK